MYSKVYSAGLNGLEAQKILVEAVGQNIRDREFLQSGCSCSLDDSDKGNVVRSQLVKFDLKLLHITGSIMRT